MQRKFVKCLIANVCICSRELFLTKPQISAAYVNTDFTWVRGEREREGDLMLTNRRSIYIYIWIHILKARVHRYLLTGICDIGADSVVLVSSVQHHRSVPVVRASFKHGAEVGESRVKFETHSHPGHPHIPVTDWTGS